MLRSVQRQKFVEPLVKCHSSSSLSRPWLPLYLLSREERVAGFTDLKKFWMETDCLHEKRKVLAACQIKLASTFGLIYCFNC